VKAAFKAKTMVTVSLPIKLVGTDFIDGKYKHSQKQSKKASKQL
jgi:hypothetical protein